MKLTNHRGLPAQVVEAVRDTYVLKGDISATGLIAPIQQSVLKSRYEDQLEEDASDRIWSLFGQAAHVILERAGEEQVTEKTLAIQIITDKSENKIQAIPVDEASTPHIGMTLSGTADLIEGKKIVDYKTTSVWTHIYGSRIKDWTLQLNIYRLLAETNGIHIEELEVVEILRDWQESKTKEDTYPQSSIMMIPIEVMPIEDISKYITDRVQEYAAQRALPDNMLTPCTPEERWAKPTTYAVYKKNLKRATRVFQTQEEAQALADSIPGSRIEIREGANVRCERYCPVSKFCNQNRKQQ